MNVRLTKIWHWQSGLVFNDTFRINTYEAQVHMHTTSMHQHDHETAYSRMEHWFLDVMQDSVLINAQSDSAKHYLQTGQRVLLFPDQPVDQLVGIMLATKLNSILENRLIVTDIDISSAHGSDMIYHHNQHEAIGPFADDGWWYDPRPIWYHDTAHNKGRKVVSLSKTMDWSVLDLDWHHERRGQDSSVVFANFDRDENQ